MSDFIRDAQDAEQAETATCPDCGHSSCHFFGYLCGFASFMCRRCKLEFQVELVHQGGLTA